MIRVWLLTAMVPVACSPTTTSTGGLGCEAEETTPTEIQATAEPGTTIQPTTIQPTATDAPATIDAPSTSQPAVTEAPTTSIDPDDPVVLAQIRLTELGYWPGPVDGAWGGSTAHAVTAYQKLNGMAVTGQLDDDLLAHLDGVSRPVPRHPDRPGLEIDLDHQVALLVVDGRVRWVLDISSGASTTPTPTGDYRVVREIDGNRVAPLGTLYRPKYFNGGIALHGFDSVPPEPASHGCVRLTFAAMDLLWAEGHLPVGAGVTVY